MSIETFEQICRKGKVRSTNCGAVPLGKEISYYCISALEKLGYCPAFDGTAICAQGTVPVLLTAHLDTVFAKPLHTIHRKENILSSPQGIGGDDRCGVYMVLELIQEFHCSVLFTTYEEADGMDSGSMCDLVKTNNVPFTDIRFIMAFDRPGNREVSFYEINNTHFENYILGDGFYTKKESEGVSDIRFITACCNIAGVNIPCGYHDNHTPEEYVDFSAMTESIEHAKILLRNIPAEKFDYIGPCISIEKNDEEETARVTAGPLSEKSDFRCLDWLLWTLAKVQSYEKIVLEFREGQKELPPYMFSTHGEWETGLVTLEQLILPRSLYFIGLNSLTGYTVEQPITIPEHIRSIPYRAFGPGTKIRTPGLRYISPEACEDGITVVEPETEEN